MPPGVPPPFRRVAATGNVEALVEALYFAMLLVHRDPPAWASMKAVVKWEGDVRIRQRSAGRAPWRRRARVSPVPHRRSSEKIKVMRAAKIAR